MDDVLTTKEVCKLLRVCKATLYRQSHLLKFKPLKIGRASRWRRKDIEKILARAGTTRR